MPGIGTLSPGRIILPPIPSIDDVDTLVSSKVIAPTATDINPIGNKHTDSASEHYDVGIKGHSDDVEYRAQALPTNGRTTLMRLFSSGPVHVASLAMYAPQTEPKLYTRAY